MHFFYSFSGISILFCIYATSAWLAQDAVRRLMELTPPMTSLTCKGAWDDLIIAGPENLSHFPNIACIAPRLDGNRGGERTDAAHRILLHLASECHNDNGGCL